MKKILIGFAAAVVGGIGFVLALPQIIEWNDYRAEIAQRVAEATGQEISIDGAVGLRLLPTPALTVSGFHIRAPGRPDAVELMGLKRLDVQVALMPLLSGRVQVENVVLVEPRVAVAVDARGAVNWHTAATAETSPPLPETGAITGSLLAKAMSFDQVLVENGRFEYRDDRVGTVEVIDKVDLRVVAGSLTGPFQITGGVTWQGTPLMLEAATGRFLETMAVPVRATLSRPRTDPDRPPTLRFAGIVGRTPAGAPRLQGDIRAEGADLRAALGLFPADDAVTGNGDPLAKPFSFRATVEASPDRLKVEGADALLGDAHATGTGSLTAVAGGNGRRDGGIGGEIQVSLTLANLNLDPWINNRKLLLTGKGATASGAAPAAPTVSSPSPMALSGQGFSLPTALRGRVDLAVDGATWRGGAINQGRLEASLKDGILTVDRLSARLPGTSVVSAAGDLTVVGGVPQLALLAQGESENLRSLLTWLQVDVDSVRNNRLGKAAMSGRLVAKPDRIDLSDLSLTVDDSHATAAVAAELRQRPALGIRFDVDRLDVDDYWPAAWNNLLRQSSKGAGKPLDRLAAREATLVQWLSAADVTIQAAAPQLTVGGVSATQFRLDATVAGGGIDVREASAANVSGARFRLSGRAGSLAPLANAHFTLSADADSMEKLLSGAVWPDSLPAPAKLGRATVEARLAGDLERTALEGRASLAGATLQVGGTVTGLPALLSIGEGPGAGIDVTSRLLHDDAVAALALVGLLPPSAAGPLDVYAKMSGDFRHLTFGDIRGSVGATALAGNLRFDRQEIRPALSGDVQLGDLDLDRWLDISPSPAVDRQQVAAPATVGGESGPAATETVVGSRLSGLSRIDGRVNLTVDRVSLGGVTVKQAAAVGRLADGVLQVDRFDGIFADGRIGGRATLVAGDGERPTGFTLALTGQDLRPSGDGLPLGPLTMRDGAADIELNLQAAGPTTAAWAANLQGDGRIAARGGVVAGLDLSAVQHSLESAETIQTALEGVGRGLRGGQTAFETLDGRCTIAQGVVSIEDTRMESAAGTMVLQGWVDLPGRQADLTLSLDPLLNPPLPFNFALRGGFDAPTRSVDIGALQRAWAERAAASRVREKN